MGSTIENAFTVGVWGETVRLLHTEPGRYNYKSLYGVGDNLFRVGSYRIFVRAIYSESYGFTLLDSIGGSMINITRTPFELWPYFFRHRATRRIVFAWLGIRIEYKNMR